MVSAKINLAFQTSMLCGAMKRKNTRYPRLLRLEKGQWPTSSFNYLVSNVSVFCAMGFLQTFLTKLQTCARHKRFKLFCRVPSKSFCRNFTYSVNKYEKQAGQEGNRSPGFFEYVESKHQMFTNYIRARESLLRRDEESCTNGPGSWTRILVTISEKKITTKQRLLSNEISRKGHENSKGWAG